MFGLTYLGLYHAVIGLFAVAAGITAFVRDGQIVPGTFVGKVYIVTTIVTCLTGFGIFEHGGFGKAYVLDLITLITMVIAALVPCLPLSRRWSAGVQIVAWSATFLFHLIPGITETTTRLPQGAPLFSNADAAGLQTIIGVLIILFVVAVTFQIIWLSKRGIAQVARAEPVAGRPSGRSSTSSGIH